MNISTNISSIQAHQTFLNTNANNVANINTDGFKPSGTVMTSSTNSVSANTRTASDNGSMQSQTDLSKEIPDQMIIQSASALNVTAIKTQNEMLGSLLDIKG